MKGHFKCYHSSDAAVIPTIHSFLFAVAHFVHKPFLCCLDASDFLFRGEFSLKGSNHRKLSKMSAKIPEVCFLAVTQKQS